MKSFLLSLAAITCLLFSSITSPAQSIPDSLAKRIDSLFTPLTEANGPGLAIGVVRNDSLIYAKGYGLANLEHNIPITPETIFHLASVSKQFAGYSIILLEREGKLKLDDDVRKYLPWFPDLKEKITIRHLLHHTSGIRDQWQLLAISGTRLDDVITQDHIVKLLSQQQALNFKPGEQHLYSNSGYTMLAEIVKSVTGKTLRQYTDSIIFTPLGMTSTHFHDDYTELVPNRASSYQRTSDQRYANSVLSYSNTGATSLFSNIKDLSKWAMNFYKPLAGTAADIRALTTNVKLNNGSTISYAAGIVADNYKGYTQYSHSGGDAGFRTYFTVLPEKKLGFIFLCNAADIRFWPKVSELMDLMLGEKNAKIAAASSKPDTSKAILKNSAAYKRYVGTYVSEEGVEFSFELQQDKLYWKRYGSSDLLIPDIKDTFVVANAPEVKFVFNLSNKAALVNQYWPGSNHRLLKYCTIDSALTALQMQSYAGTYYAPELDCKYKIEVVDGKLVLTHNKYKNSTIRVLGADHLFTEHWWMEHILIVRDTQKKIIGFDVNDGRILHLRFNKIN